MEFLKWSDVMEFNRKWWNLELGGYHILDYGYYTVDDIVKENKYANKLKELNNKIVTIDSQDETSDIESSKAHINFLDQHNMRYLKDVLCKEYQRPYLDFFCTKKQLEKIKKLDNDKIGYCYVYMDDIHNEININDVLKNMMDDRRRVNLTKVVFDNGEKIEYTNLHLNDDFKSNGIDVLDKVDKKELDNIVFVCFVYDHYGYNDNYESNMDKMCKFLIKLLE
jgi:hypothetical protein